MFLKPTSTALTRPVLTRPENVLVCSAASSLYAH